MAIPGVERWTIDTNILIYFVDSSAGARHDMALGIIDRAMYCDCRLTLQALAEFAAVTLRKRVMPRDEVARQVEEWIDLFDPIIAVPANLRVALTGVQRFSSWDALLLAVAASGGCTAILSEDMADGAMLGPIRVVHPFDGDRLSAGALALLG